MNLGRLASLSRHAHGMRTACAHMACARDETKRASGSPCHADGALYACGVTKDCLTDLERRRYQTWWTLADHPGCRGHHQSPIPRRPGPPWPRRPTAAQTATRGLRRFGGRTWTEQKLRVLASEAKDAEMLAKEVATEAAILVEGLNGQEGHGPFKNEPSTGKDLQSSCKLCFFIQLLSTVFMPKGHRMRPTSRFAPPFRPSICSERQT
ncbi:unnamed protein product [Durusdinium trenchii]|uniref:Uncharacterized protein n=1 Tax=Durusdinium trenchii TaxID=1381693 RepID=A0ABP0MIA2_9DINO